MLRPVHRVARDRLKRTITQVIDHISKFGPVVGSPCRSASDRRRPDVNGTIRDAARSDRRAGGRPSHRDGTGSWDRRRAVDPHPARPPHPGTRPIRPTPVSGGEGVRSGSGRDRSVCFRPRRSSSRPVTRWRLPSPRRPARPKEQTGAAPGVHHVRRRARRRSRSSGTPDRTNDDVVEYLGRCSRNTETDATGLDPEGVDCRPVCTLVSDNRTSGRSPGSDDADAVGRPVVRRTVLVARP